MMRKADANSHSEYGINSSNLQIIVPSSKKEFSNIIHLFTGDLHVGKEEVSFGEMAKKTTNSHYMR